MTSKTVFAKTQQLTVVWLQNGLVGILWYTNGIIDIINIEARITLGEVKCRMQIFRLCW